MEGLGIRDEAREFVGVLEAWRRLDSAGDVERVGIERRGLGDRRHAHEREHALGAGCGAVARRPTRIDQDG